MSDCTNDLIDKLNHAYCKINALNIELQHYSNMLTRLERQNDELIKVFEQMEINNKKIEEENINFKKDIDILQEENINFKKDIDILQEENINFKKDIDILQEENKLLKDFNLIEKY